MGEDGDHPFCGDALWGTNDPVVRNEAFGPAQTKAANAPNCRFLLSVQDSATWRTTEPRTSVARSSPADGNHHTQATSPPRPTSRMGWPGTRKPGATMVPTLILSGFSTSVTTSFSSCPGSRGLPGTRAVASETCCHGRASACHETLDIMFEVDTSAWPGCSFPLPEFASNQRSSDGVYRESTCLVGP